MDNVPAIVPLLEREHRVAESRLATSKKELDDLATDKLKVRWGVQEHAASCCTGHSQGVMCGSERNSRGGDSVACPAVQLLYMRPCGLRLNSCPSWAVLVVLNLCICLRSYVCTALSEPAKHRLCPHAVCVAGQGPCVP